MEISVKLVPYLICGTPQEVPFPIDPVPSLHFGKDNRRPARSAGKKRRGLALRITGHIIAPDPVMTAGLDNNAIVCDCIGQCILLLRVFVGYRVIIVGFQKGIHPCLDHPNHTLTGNGILAFAKPLERLGYSVPVLGTIPCHRYQDCQTRCPNPSCRWCISSRLP